jgi:hypothetical protein
VVVRWNDGNSAVFRSSLFGGGPANNKSACDASHAIATQALTFCLICTGSVLSKVLLAVWCKIKILGRVLREHRSEMVVSGG